MRLDAAPDSRTHANFFKKETETKIYSSSSSPLAPLLLLSSASSSSSPLPHSEFSSSPLLDTESASEPSPRAFSEIVAIERAVSGVVVCCKVAAAGAWLPRSSVAATAADELSHSRNMSQCIFRTFRSGDNHSAAAGGEEPPPPLITAQGDCRNPRRHAWRSGTDLRFAVTNSAGIRAGTDDYVSALRFSRRFAFAAADAVSEERISESGSTSTSPAATTCIAVCGASCTATL